MTPSLLPPVKASKLCENLRITQLSDLSIFSAFLLLPHTSCTCPPDTKLDLLLYCECQCQTLLTTESTSLSRTSKETQGYKQQQKLSFRCFSFGHLQSLKFIASFITFWRAYPGYCSAILENQTFLSFPTLYFRTFPLTLKVYSDLSK